MCIFRKRKETEDKRQEICERGVGRGREKGKGGERGKRKWEKKRRRKGKMGKGEGSEGKW